MRSVYIETYGCQMNLADTELLFGHLGRHGYRRTDDPAAADVILLNTCAIREHAEERVVGRLGDLVRHKTRRPDVQLGLAGCMAQHLRDTLMSKLPFVDFVVGPDAYRRLPELLGNPAGDPFVDVRLDRTETYADIVPQREGGVRAWVTVMRGCDKFCTFCVVPYVRGRERSLPARAILDQVRRLADEGCREVVYLGQTVNAYRDGDVDFAELLQQTDAVDGIERIRFTSPHPSDMTERVVEAMAGCRKVCPQLHLPVQSGSDRVLEKMERGYTAAQYLDLVARLRRAVPGIALSTDIIVGFPGEDESDFEATCGLMRAVGYDSAFMFKYSARSGTKAFKWPETVSEEEKSRRLQAIIALQEEQSAAINRGLIGSTVEVLVEGPARRREGWSAGKTLHFKTAVFPSSGARAGDLARVRITDSTTHTLVGAACALL
ncbi:MAG TPA: tRNA (N6-isopentenyl adenosine(37)-C2)-methylthiotransferase MiaB [Candidatus Acidoferrales bacterium]|nr:tRNA (N6-isopentenyl adenosine(37)-C2)-methylthiotransferase MiaB [Candidatus Acidoferrales bacterium]